MLLRFQLENFLSFKNKQEFSMFPGRVKKHQERLIDDDVKILNFSAIYGANASGKSNFVKGIDFARNFILIGKESLEKTNYEINYFKLEKSMEEKPSIFEFEFKADNKAYAYGYSLNIYHKKIINEWLYEINEETEDMIYEIDYVKKKHKISYEKTIDKDKMNILADDLFNMKSTLMLTEAFRRKYYNKKNSLFKTIYSWFYKNLKVIYPDTVSKPITTTFKNKDDDKLIQLLDYFDLGIKGYKYEKRTLEQIESIESGKEIRQIINNIKKGLDNSENSFSESVLQTNNHLYKFKKEKKKIVVAELIFEKGKNKVEFSLGEESDGTKRLIELITMIYNEEKNIDSTFIVDEMDRSLHPQLVKKFVEYFFKQNSRNQLIMTSHESTLMDLNILRRDEIWIVDREDESLESILYSLDKFNVRFDKDIHKAYLQGRYGGIPIFKNSDCFEEER